GHAVGHPHPRRARLGRELTRRAHRRVPPRVHHRRAAGRRGHRGRGHRAGAGAPAGRPRDRRDPRAGGLLKAAGRRPPATWTPQPSREGTAWKTAPVPSMRFTLRQLEYFLAAADAGSVTEAAQNIPVAQSSVSAAIAQLEAALGVQLLIRHHAQGISPTAEGRQFIERARLLLRNADELERFAAELTAELSGTLHLGCLVTVAPLMMPRLGKGFRELHPAVALEMVEAGQQELVTQVRSGRLSVALTYDLNLADDLSFTALASLPPYACFATDHPLAQADSVTMAQLAGEPLVLLDLAHSREYFRALFSAAGVEPRIAHRSVHPDVIR